jgi:hypothetical protein
VTEPDLTREQLAELSIALARVIFDVDDPAARGLVGRPRVPRGTAGAGKEEETA